MDADLDTLVTALYVEIDDLIGRPRRPWAASFQRCIPQRSSGPIPGRRRTLDHHAVVVLAYPAYHHAV